MIAYRPDQGSNRLISAVEYLEQGGAEKVVLGPPDYPAVAQVASGREPVADLMGDRGNSGKCESYSLNVAVLYHRAA